MGWIKSGLEHVFKWIYFFVQTKSLFSELNTFAHIQSNFDGVFGPTRVAQFMK